MAFDRDSSIFISSRKTNKIIDFMHTILSFSLFLPATHVMLFRILSRWNNKEFIGKFEKLIIFTMTNVMCT